MNRTDRWDPHFIGFSVLAVLILLLSLRYGDLSGYDDALYAHEAKQMILTGDWWNVRFNGRLNFEHPPMFMWLQALSMQAWGFTDSAAKFPAALAGIATVVLIYFVAFEMMNDRWFALLSMVVLLSTQYFLKYSMHAMTDVPCAFFFLLAVFAYLKGLRNHKTACSGCSNIQNSYCETTGHGFRLLLWDSSGTGAVSGRVIPIPRCSSCGSAGSSFHSQWPK